MEQVMVVLQGLAGAGKSTWAKAWSEADPQRRVVVNRDQIRYQLFSRYNDLTPEQEAVVTDVEFGRACQSLRAGKSVVIDATNLKREYRSVWAELAVRHGVRYELVTIDTSLAECLRRNRARAAAGGRFVPEDAIRAMYESAQQDAEVENSAAVTVGGLPADLDAVAAQVDPIKARYAVARVCAALGCQFDWNPDTLDWVAEAVVPAAPGHCPPFLDQNPKAVIFWQNIAGRR